MVVGERPSQPPHVKTKAPPRPRPAMSLVAESRAEEWRPNRSPMAVHHSEHKGICDDQSGHKQKQAQRDMTPDELGDRDDGRRTEQPTKYGPDSGRPKSFHGNDVRA